MHSAAVLRLTGSERAVAEIAATAEHMASLSLSAAAFQLAPDLPDEPASPAVGAVELLDQSTAPQAAGDAGRDPGVGASGVERRSGAESMARLRASPPFARDRVA